MVGIRPPCPCCGQWKRPPAALNRWDSCPIPSAALPPPTKILRSSSDPFPFTCIVPRSSDDRLEIRPSPIPLLPPIPSPAPPRPPLPPSPSSCSDLTMDPISPFGTLTDVCLSNSPHRPIIDPAKINVSDPMRSASKTTEAPVPVSDPDPDPDPLPHLVLASLTEKKVRSFIVSRSLLLLLRFL